MAALPGLLPVQWPWGQGLGGSFGMPSKTAPPGTTATAVFGLPAWTVAVILCILSSLLSVSGLALQKQAATASAHRPRLGSLVLSKRWFCGCFTGVIFPIPLQMYTYSIAPMSLLTPLSGITVVLNMLVAPLLLGERPQLRVDVPASLFIMGGTVASTLTGTHTEVDYDFRTLLELWKQFECLLALGLLSVVMLFSCGYMRRSRAHIEERARSRPSNPILWHVVLPALVAAGSGCFTNIMLKASGELVKGHAVLIQVILCLVATLLPALVQLNFVNKGLALYQQTVFVPVYSSLLVLTNTLSGLIFYREYVVLVKHRERCSWFFVGVSLVIFGVFLFMLRKPDKADKQGADSRMLEGTASQLADTAAAAA